MVRVVGLDISSCIGNDVLTTIFHCNTHKRRVTAPIRLPNNGSFVSRLGLAGFLIDAVERKETVGHVFGVSRQND